MTTYLTATGRVDSGRDSAAPVKLTALARWALAMGGLGIVATIPGLAHGAPFVYVGSSLGRVTIIDAATDTYTSVSVAPERYPEGVAVNRSSSRVYVANRCSAAGCPPVAGSVSVLETASNTVTKVIPVGVDPRYLGLNATGALLYVPNSTAGNVSVIDTATNSVVTTVPVSGAPLAIVAHPLGLYWYASVGNGVVVVDSGTNTVKGTVPLGSAATGLAIDTGGITLYVGTATGVSVIDAGKAATLPSSAVVSTVPLGSDAAQVALTPNGLKLYATNFALGAGNTVQVIDTGLAKSSPGTAVVKTITVGQGPVGVAVIRDGTKAYVANSASESVSVIDVATDTVIKTLGVFGKPMGVATPLPERPVFLSSKGEDTCEDKVTKSVGVLVKKLISECQKPFYAAKGQFDLAGCETSFVNDFTAEVGGASGCPDCFTPALIGPVVRQLIDNNANNVVCVSIENLDGTTLDCMATAAKGVTSYAIRLLKKCYNKATGEGGEPLGVCQAAALERCKNGDLKLGTECPSCLDMSNKVCPLVTNLVATYASLVRCAPSTTTTTTLPVPAVCGNGLCEPGEQCSACGVFCCCSDCPCPPGLTMQCPVSFPVCIGSPGAQTCN